MERTGEKSDVEGRWREGSWGEAHLVADHSARQTKTAVQLVAPSGMRLALAGHHEPTMKDPTELIGFSPGKHVAYLR